MSPDVLFLSNQQSKPEEYSICYDVWERKQQTVILEKLQTEKFLAFLLKEIATTINGLLK